MAEKQQDLHGAGPCQPVGDGITRVFALLGKRWTGLIVAALMPHPAHFVDLRRAIPGISERMLSDRLTELAAAGLVLREVKEGPPLRVTYRLTDAGAALDPALRELAAWAKIHLPRSGPCAGAERE
ncbi:winged helix-turn-helix transcriptional regulator [Streptomyces heilongjiangensis]|uniref:Winged helix-turn-helix transcriptional regulator n=1 Tax=Streptomyces heilongjiangensis TaxID=945052 RepID=A0ABW1BE22_9ACTN|nr:helix-turn-helix domain-containing protein [Streptomyces heilongjiangensis]MDC2946107.1 helix-turn-helix domain-containing protein [Streptomyces heilongjiangensis]